MNKFLGILLASALLSSCALVQGIKQDRLDQQALAAQQQALAAQQAAAPTKLKKKVRDLKAASQLQRQNPPAS
jgi:outer membrane murein-binding lipoprotein Lpp